MLEFQELTVKEGARLRPYYETCDYRLCEYSLGVKLMWRDYLHPWFTEAAGCLIIRNCIEGQYVFDYPILGPEGDAGAALAAIEQYCGDKELPLVLSVVPEDKASQLVLRYPRVTVISERPWKDYLYHTEDLAQFAGRRYSGQRNHINKFRRDYPDAAFVALTDPNDPRLTAFWADYEAEFHKTGPLAKQELTLAQEMFSLLDTGWFCAGGMLAEGRLVAVSLAEKRRYAGEPHREGIVLPRRRVSRHRTGLCRLLRRRLRLDQSGGRCQGQGAAHLQAPVPAGGAGRQGAASGGHGAGYPEAGALPENGAPDPDGPAPFG